MSEKITFKKAAEEYLAEETKMGKEKNENAIQQLEWMYKKRPTFIACPVTSRRVRYGLVSRSKHPDYVPIAWDETSGIFEGVDITEITKKDVKAVQKRLLNSRGLSNGCVNSYMSYMRAVFNYANDEMELRFRAPKIVNLPVEERKFILTPKQAKGLILCLDPLRADLVRMALLTGQRKSNIVSMRWNWIKRDMSEISIPPSEMKNGEGHVISVVPEVKALLEKRLAIRKRLLEKYAWLEDSGYVFVQEPVDSFNKTRLGQPLKPRSVTGDAWKKAIRLYNQRLVFVGKKSGRGVDEALLIPDVACVFHTCRHTFATWQKNNGSDIDDIMMVGNWKSADACRRYVKQDGKRFKSVASRIEGIL